MSFVHLHVHSPFSFLDGAGKIEEMVTSAAAAGMPALALTDHNNLCGAILFSGLAKKAGIKPITGVEITLGDDSHLTLLAKNPDGYTNLCRILSAAHLGNPRQTPRTSYETLRAYSSDLAALSGCRKGRIPQLILKGHYRLAEETAQTFADIFGRENFFIEMQQDFLPGSRFLNSALDNLASHRRLKTAATNNVHYVTKEQFKIHDLLTCVRTLTKLEEIHPERRLNAENYLKSPAEMAQIFGDYPQAVTNTLAIAEMCQPALETGNRLFPAFPDIPPGETAAGYLRKLTFKGARERYRYLPRQVTSRLDHELDIICRLGFEDYFLLVWDAANYARREKIRYAGRGSAADSAVAYCLYITEVDSIARNLLFERFMSLERAQTPDIDIDFDSRHRDRVSAYLYKKYGADRVATVCTYNTFRARSAFRDLAKAMDFPAAEIDRLAKKLPYIQADQIDLAVERFPELRESGIDAPGFRDLLDYCGAVSGFPRFIGTHLGGIVVSRCPLSDVTPLQEAAKGIVVTQYDKEFIEDIGLVKLDLLSLRTMSAIEDTTLTIRETGSSFDYETIPLDDKATFAMLNKGETVGVFQLESPAQRALQSRLGASEMEDIIASVAIIRPGPIKGNMVEPFIARRQGKEPVTYLHPKLEPILKKTYGVVLYQEQVIEIATAIAGFTPGEADRLRRVMTHARSHREMAGIGADFIKKAAANGVSTEVAETIFSYITGYASYGFCEAHAAAFATTAYKTAYLIKHYPAHFFASVLSHQPMGFYDANTLCVEARRRGVTILPPDINLSRESFTVDANTIRISLRQIKGVKDSSLEKILTARKNGPFRSFDDFLKRIRPDRNVLENLICCGAFDSLRDNRKQLLWAIPAAGSRGNTGELALTDNMVTLPSVPDFTPQEKFNMEYEILGIDVTSHYMSHWRTRLERRGFLNSRNLAVARDSSLVNVAGLPVRPHRPPTRTGKIAAFFSLEDEFGLIDITVFEKTYQKFGNLLFTRPVPPLQVWGTLQHRGNGFSIIARQISRLQ
ncbi:DNA polymerase III subunit alpha [Phosphitispora fastidiosa]|uniref:DNA polymerase III subunit alpha n=1 Tax=Phosphitispora fastidiosa TaxID=2837202 RepID=UPI001E63FB4E|nr:DNA polymerase III subunit alpha [Phosphitispora fastidiosa]MBU7006802.1 error-prone DNA polymerase [Phosphitispora fastidiosa]